MCLLLIAYRTQPGFPLVVAGNRDEFHERPTEPAHWWQEPRILGGRDLEAGGTWFAINPQGRFATVTNYREPSVHEPGAFSRGELPVMALTSDDPSAFSDWLERSGARYNGFNLLFGDAGELRYASNKQVPGRVLAPGVYGLSNETLDAPWPKVRRGKALFDAELGARETPVHEALVELLHDRQRPSDSELPDTGIGLELERLLAPMFIISQRYGTRASTVLTVSDEGHVAFTEQNYNRQGERTERREFAFMAGG